MNANHIALVTAITIIAATAAYNPANADELMTCRDASKGDATLKTCKVLADMTPHKDLTGTDLMVWNKFCKGQDPKKVFEWRYNRCHGLSSEFVR